jgi:hypothetical protein
MTLLVATIDHSSDGRLLPITTVLHCSDVIVAIGRLPRATVDYGPMLQCLFVVVRELKLMACSGP